MSDYFRNKETGLESVKYMEISTGFVLTKFDEKSGTQYGNPCYKYYVSKEDLKEKFEEITFVPKLTSSDKEKRAIKAAVMALLTAAIDQGKFENFTSINDFHGIEYELHNLDELMDHKFEQITFKKWLERIMSARFDHDDFDLDTYTDCLYYAKDIIDNMKIAFEAIK